MMIESIVRPLSAALRRLGVRRLGVFGSVLRGDARPESDVDVLVEFEPASQTYDGLFAVGDLLESAFHRKVDLLTPGSLSPHIGPNILREVRYVEIGS